MPITNGTYTSPNWSTNGPPPLSEDELQAITDTTAVVPTLVRPNLLDNAYFIGGGSQQGGGQLPINQRGQSSYTGAVYGIDRWKAVFANSTVSLVSGGVKIAASASLSAGSRLWYQFVENYEALIGQKLTLSIFVSALSGGNIRASIRWVINGSPTNKTLIISGTGLFTLTDTVPNSITSLSVNLMTLSNTAMASGDYITIAAMKLEVGSTQSLAHWDGTQYVLNEIPNYKVELARCQRFCYVMNTVGEKNGTFGTGVANTTSNCRVVIPFPVTMRAIPTLTVGGSNFMLTSNSNYLVDASGISLQGSNWPTTDVAVVNAAPSTSMTAGESYVFRAAGDTDARLIFSADM